MGLDSNPSYGHTPSHHTPQLSSLSFKHEDTLSPPNNIGNCLHPDVFSLNWLADWRTVMSQQGYISNPSFFISQQHRRYPFSFISLRLCLHTHSYTQAYINTLSLSRSLSTRMVNDSGNDNLRKQLYVTLLECQKLSGDQYIIWAWKGPLFLIDPFSLWNEELCVCADMHVQKCAYVFEMNW